ncbi:MAG: YadA C-terminal domain-containing protein, partial [Bacteroidales bacterium]|nr:YadA C-terminal domain-containing protein [Bacteroidales bacterium]
NKAAIEANGKAINENKAAIESVGQAVNENKTAIETIGSAVNANKAAIEAVGQAVNDNKAAIEENGKAINENKLAIAQKADASDLGNIKAYTSQNIVTNGDSAVTAISKLDEAIGDPLNLPVYPSKARLASTPTVVDTILGLDNRLGNVDDYSSQKIVENGDSAVTAISKLDAAVDENKQNILTNTADIATNKKDIAANKTDIAANKTAIDNETSARIAGDKNLQDQIDNIGGNLAQDVDRLKGDLKSVGALAAAMSGLHPRFTAGSKGEFAAAIGNYDGKKATAIGAFYAPDEKIMFSLGGAIAAGGKSMANLGVNIALDPKPKKLVANSYSKAEVDAMLAEKDAKIDALLARLEALESKK